MKGRRSGSTRSLKREMIASSLISTMLPVLLVSLMVLHVYLNNARKHMETIYVNNLYAAREIVQTALNGVQDISLYLSVEPNVTRFLDTPAAEDDYKEAEENARSVVSMLTTSNRFFQGITLLSPSGQSISCGLNQQKIGDAAVRAAQKAKGYYVWSSSMQGRPYVYMCRQLRLPANLKINRGYLQVILSLNALGASFPIPLHQPDIRYVIVNAQGEVFFTSNRAGERDAALVRDLIADGRMTDWPFLVDRASGMMVTACDIETTDWKIFSLAPCSYLDRSLHLIHIMIFALLGMCMALCVWSAIRSTRAFVEPLNRLAGLMKNVSEEQFGVQLETPPHEELRPLAEQFNEMSSRLKTLYQQNYLNQLEAVRSQLQMLESQINPHFLYNVLDTIYWAVRTNQTQSACAMCTSLSGLLHMTLSRESAGGMISLKQELELLSHYLTIQQIRYGDALRFTLNVEPGLEDAQVCKLILQPMVENAILHGIDRLGEGEIRVNVYARGDDLIYEISDSCALAEEEVVEKALHGGGREEGASHGLALYNIDRRIKLVYGPSYGVRFERLPQASLFVITMRRSSKQREEGERCTG